MELNFEMESIGDRENKFKCLYSSLVIATLVKTLILESKFVLLLFL